jgi:hypothetical protein
MRFYGNGIVWDAENDCMLMKFIPTEYGKLGTYDTDDKRIQQILINGGYKHDGKEEALKKVEVLPDVPVTENVAESVADEAPAKVTADLDVKQLRELGRQRGLAFKPGTTKIDMAKAINAK